MSQFCIPVSAKLFSTTEIAPSGKSEKNKTFVSLQQKVWTGCAALEFQAPAWTGFLKKHSYNAAAIVGN